MNWLDFTNTLKDKTCGVYCIKNIINSKVYIGISTDLKHRIKTHYHKLKANKHNNKHLQYSVNEHGIESFTIEIIEFTDEKNLLIKEHLYQQFYKSTNSEFGYNVLITDPEGSIRHSEDSKQKISIGNKGKTRSLETRKKLSTANSGKKGSPHTEEFKAQQSLRMKERVVTEETRNKMSLARTGVPSPNKGKKIGPMASESIALMAAKRTGSLNPRAVKVQTKDNIEYGTIKEAAYALKVSRSTIKKLVKEGALKRV